MKSQGDAKSPQDLKKEKDRRQIIEAMRKRVPAAGSGIGCFLCKLIVEDFDQNGKLTSGPKDFNGHGIFPYEGKVEHIKIERPTLDIECG